MLGLVLPAFGCSFPDVTFGAIADAAGSADAAAVDGAVPEGSLGSGESSATDAPGIDASVDQGPTQDVAAGADATVDGAADSGSSDVAVDAPNCSCGPSTYRYQTFVSCGALMLGVLCTSTEGFTGNPPPCGAPADYVVCTPNGIGCGATHSTRVQQCK
jgi:hypothetical protein